MRASSLLVFVLTGLYGCASSNTGGSLRPVSQADAVAAIIAMPEYQAYVGNMIAARGGEVRPVIRPDGDVAADRGDVSTGPYWGFYVGEDHPDHQVLWHLIRVHRDTGELFVMEPVDGRFLPVSQWRRQGCP